MTTTAPPVQKAIRWILVLQVGVAILMFSTDLLGRLPSILSPSKAPTFDRPTAPGDQTRRYAPRRITTGPDTSPLPRRLVFDREGDVLTLTGAIEQGDAARFDEELNRVGTIETIRLMSPGGSVLDALDIGRRLRDERLSTEMTADGVCLSACPYILAAGTERRVHISASVGVHQHYFGESTVLPAFTAVEDIQRGQGEVMRYLDEMGVDPLVMQHALVTPPDEIYILTPNELETYGLATEIGDR
ncbi:hypothetical protein AAD018_012745 [Aestuariibius insulae]|uniref:COG3904 family protein n=1 Tax=Aestuariibius insulae TaxID=2058287 RepID=UPI00345E1056